MINTENFPSPIAGSIPMPSLTSQASQGQSCFLIGQRNSLSNLHVLQSGEIGQVANPSLPVHRARNVRAVQPADVLLNVGGPTISLQAEASQMSGRTTTILYHGTAQVDGLRISAPRHAGAFVQTIGTGTTPSFALTSHGRRELGSQIRLQQQHQSVQWPNHPSNRMAMTSLPFARFQALTNENNSTAPPSHHDQALCKVGSADLLKRPRQTEEGPAKISAKKEKPTSPASETGKRPKSRRSRKAHPTDRPKRPLSAYNIFFQYERAKMLGEARNDGGMVAKGDADRKKSKPISIGFAEMARTISRKWKAIDPETMAFHEKKAAAEKERYKEQMRRYNKKQQEALEKDREELLATVDDETKRRYFQGAQNPN